METRRAAENGNELEEMLLWNFNEEIDWAEGFFDARQIDALEIKQIILGAVESFLRHLLRRKRWTPFTELLTELNIEINN